MTLRFSVAVLLGSMVSSSAALAAPSADEKAILKIEQDMSASQTTAAATATWDKNVVLDDMLTITPHTDEYVGLDAARKDFDPQFAAYTFSVKILRIKVETDGKLGFAYSTQHFLAKNKKSGQVLDIVFREADCFKKKGGKWTLLYQNLSVPFDPATGKAVFDSK